MKQKITVALDPGLWKRARKIAAERGASVSALLAEELLRITDRDSAYELARRRALARLRAPLRLGGKKRASRESLHERSDVR